MQSSYFCPYCPGIRYTLSHLRGILYCAKCKRIAQHQPFAKKQDLEPRDDLTREGLPDTD